MAGPLLAYILIWLGLFTLFCAVILWLGPRTQSRIIKAMASRLSPEAPAPPGSLPPMEVFTRLGAIFLALGLLLLLLMAPEAEAHAAARWRIILAEAALAVVVIWQVVTLRGKFTSRPQAPGGPKAA